MKSKVKQILSVLLTVCMLATVVPINAYAADVDFSADEVTADANVDAEKNVDVDISEGEPIDDSDVDVSVEEEPTDEELTDVTDESSQDEELFTSDAVEEFSAESNEELDNCYTLTKATAPQLTEDFFKIVFVDCGRKYFSVDSLEKIIDNASAAGFNYVELGIGNDGLRFLLDDMSLSVNGKDYTSEEVSNAIHTGNENYCNFTTDELTQSEMDTIIEYASSKGVGIIPMLNTPGHMDAILLAVNSLTGENCSYSGSVRTIDVTNATAVAFTQAIVQKYINYFKGQGCKLFNMGADEYANDKFTTGSMGFGQLQKDKNYSYYVKYVNKMADMIKAAGMTPMAFNDGIYFNNDTSTKFDNSIVVCYWSNGWSGYTPMSASNIASKGFRMINTNGDYYWVLGKDAQCSASKAAEFKYTEFPGKITINNPLGAMFCIWCDYPRADTEENIVSKTADTISAFGKTLPATSSNSPVNPTITPSPVTSEDGTVIVKADGVKNIVCVSKDEKEIPEIEGAVKIIAYEITPKTEDNENYTNSGEVSIKVPEGWNDSRLGAFVINDDSTVTKLSGIYADDFYTFEVPHFSIIGLYEVAEEDVLSSKLNVEYWITNRPVTAESSMSKEISANDPSVNSEKGAKFSDLVPQNGIYQSKSNNMTFWKGTRLTSDKKQTKDKGVDRTKSGNDFVYIRYWKNTWEFSSDGENWTKFNTDDQVVAYYLQTTDVTNEIKTEVVDWGADRSKYNSSDYVLLDYAVRYPSGDRTPETFATDKTIAFHCDSEDTTTVHKYGSGDGWYWHEYYREIGMIRAENTDDYEVYMITVTPTSNSNMEEIAGSAASASSYTYDYDNNEKVIWVDKEEDLGEFEDESKHFTSISGKYNYKVGGEATIDGLEIFNRHGMLVTYYLRTKVTKASLNVHYVNKNTNKEFYEYPITVNTDTRFDEAIGLNQTKPNGPLVKGTVTNSLGKTQTVSADLSSMPQISAAYRYSDYECVEVIRSDDGKDVFLYYTFKDEHNFVVDYGLKLKITMGDLNLENAGWSFSTVTKPTYGKVILDADGETLTYVPEKVIKGIDDFNLTLTNGTDSITHTIHIYPATSVYYEETFVDGGVGSTKSSSTQKASIEGSKDNYGYDLVYDNAEESSDNTSLSLTDTGETFSFEGTGVDVYANTDTNEAIMSIAAYRGSELEKFKVVIVNTQMKNEETATGQEVTGYNVPVTTMDFKDWNSYKLELKQVKGDVELDGFRVFNTLDSEETKTSADNVYAKDDEAAPKYYELRDQVLNALGIKSNKYADQISGNIYSQIHATGGVASAVILDSSVEENKTTPQDMLDNGPKNEIYLQPTQTLVFKLGSKVTSAQLGLSGLNGSTTVEITNGSFGTRTVSTTEMYYVISKQTSGEQTFRVTNKGKNILSVTKLKVFGNINESTKTFASLTETDLTAALVGLGYEKAPEPTATATPTPTVTATAAPTQKPVQQIKLATPKLGKVVSTGYNALKLNWSKVNGADGYRVYVKVNGQWKALGNTKSTTYVHKKLETGKSYTYTVKAYKNTKSGTVWSSYDKKGITGKAALSAPSLRKAKRTSAKKATLSWKKVNGASGYVVYRKTNNGRWQIVKKITKGNITSFTDKKLSKGKKYTYTVRAYRTVGKKNIYSGYNKKGLKVK